MATVAAIGPSFAVVARRAVAGFAARAYAKAKTGAATAVGVAGMGSVAFGVGMVYLPAGFIVGGALAVWFASLLPAGDR